MAKVFPSLVLLFAKLLTVGAQLNLYIAKNDVNSYLKFNFNFDLYMITNNEPVTLLKDSRGFYDFMSPLQSSVNGVKMRLYSSPQSSYYSFKLMSSDPQLMSNPVASIANQGVVPHTALSFYISLDCTGRKAGLVDIAMELNYTKIVSNSVHSSSLKTFFIQVKKWCDKTVKDPDKGTDKAINHWSRGAIVGLSAGITVFLCLSVGLGLLIKHHLKQRRLKMEFEDDLELDGKRQFGLKKVTSLPIHKPASTTTTSPPVLYSPKRPKLRVARPITRQRSETNTSDTSTLELICKEESDDEITGQKTHYVQEDTWSNSLSAISLNPEHLEVKERIAKGFSGDVYHGILHDATKEVAVKIVRDGLSNDVYKEFMKTVLFTMKELDHQNVLKPLGVVLSSSTHIVLPYMKLGSLDKFLASQHGHPLSQAQILNIGHKIVKALHYLIRQNYIHKNFSSKKCMVGEDMDIKVSICHSYPNKQDKWMAPECLSSDTVSAESNVWSFGVVIWELTSVGESPYSDVESTVLLEYLQSGRRLNQSLHCSDELYSVMLRCWSVNPADRPACDWLLKWFTKRLDEYSTLC